MKKSKSKPSVDILDSFDDLELCDKITFQMIEEGIVDQLKPREFDCLFLSATKRTAKALGNTLHKTHGYITHNPHHGIDGWITNAIKLIVHSDLKHVLNIARIEAANHSSELIDWMVQVDISEPKSV